MFSLYWVVFITPNSVNYVYFLIYIFIVFNFFNIFQYFLCAYLKMLNSFMSSEFYVNMDNSHV